MKRVLRIMCLCALSLLVTEAPLQAESEGLNARSIRKLARARSGKVKTKALNTVCKKISNLQHALMKNTAGGHISSADPRYPGISLICGSDCARSFPVNAYYSDGNLAFKLGYYGKWSGNGKPRAYCGAGGAPACYASSVKTNARRSGRDGYVYLHFGNKSCRKARPGERNGSPF